MLIVLFLLPYICEKNAIRTKLQCVLRFYVDVANCTLQDTDLGAILRALKHQRFLGDANDLTDNATDSGDLITDLQAIAHLLLLALLLLLRTNDKEIEEQKHCAQ